jgi:hypothetical protein
MGEPNDNLIYFPTHPMIDGLVWHGGRGFKTVRGFIRSLSVKDLRRVLEYRERHAERFESKRPQSGGAAA